MNTITNPVLSVIAACCLAFSAQAATITPLASFADFQSTHIAIEDFETPLDDRTEFSFDSTAAQFPTNSNQQARSGQTFLAETGNNMPLFVDFHVDTYEVGFYAGNDSNNLWGFAQWFYIDAYNPSGVLLGSITVSANVNDLIDTFVGLRSDEALGSIGIRFNGTNSLATPSIAIDDFGIGYESAAAVPLPSSLILLLSGAGLLGLFRQRVVRG